MAASKEGSNSKSASGQQNPLRGSIVLEDAEILGNEAYAGEQYVMRLLAPVTAAKAQPGSFVHLRCDANLHMRRPMSIMRASPDNGWIEILYKIHGRGTQHLAACQIGETLSTLGPIGQSFRLSRYRPKPLLIGGGVGIPPMIFLADHMRTISESLEPLVLMGSEIPFPFTARPSQVLATGIPEGTIAAMPLLDDWEIASRLASRQGYPGCHNGYVTDLARAFLSDSDVNAIEIFACGPTAMLREVALLAQEFNLPCEVSLEEYMACAVGGCAGCTVGIRTANGLAMKRVCVDGPVFDAATVVFPE